MDLDIDRLAEEERIKKERSERIKSRWATAKTSVKDYIKFMAKVETGDRPTLQDLKNINQLKWNGYKDVIIAEHKDSQQYVSDVLNDIKKSHDEVTVHKVALEDLVETYDAPYRLMDKKIKKNIEAAGLTKVIYGYEFKEFSMMNDTKSKCKN